MATEITDAELQKVLSEGVSQNEIARRTGIPRSTLRRRLEKIGIPDVYTGTQTAEKAPKTDDELQEMLAWWRERKRALQRSDDPEHETERKTYHIEKQYIEAIQRASDLEHASITEIVNRALGYYFNREHD